jgi:hypothetical protein
VLADWRVELDRIAAAFDELQTPADTAEQISAFITPSLRHHGSDAREPAAPMPAIVQEVRDREFRGRPVVIAFEGVASASSTHCAGGPLIRDLTDQLAGKPEPCAIDRARDDRRVRCAIAQSRKRTRGTASSRVARLVDALTAEIRRRGQHDALAADVISRARRPRHERARDRRRAKTSTPRD